MKVNRLHGAAWTSTEFYGVPLSSMRMVVWNSMSAMEFDRDSSADFGVLWTCCSIPQSSVEFHGGNAMDTIKVGGMKCHAVPWVAWGATLHVKLILDVQVRVGFHELSWHFGLWSSMKCLRVVSWSSMKFYEF